MIKPTIHSGKFHCGADCTIGTGVVIDVAEEVIFGDRCTIPDNAYISGRRVEVGDDFYGYSHWGKRLEIGLGRRDGEHAVLKVGSRCTFHDNRIDLTRPVMIGDDVGLSPEVVLYTHGYWQSPLNGFPCRHEGVSIGAGSIIGFRSTILPGAKVPIDSVVGACSLVPGGSFMRQERCVWGGNPVKLLHGVIKPGREERESYLVRAAKEYIDSRWYRNLPYMLAPVEYPVITFRDCKIDTESLRIEGEENEDTDDLRWHLFTHGIRVYTKRPFRKLGKR